jgi:hypothetical protein
MIRRLLRWWNKPDPIPPPCPWRMAWLEAERVHAIAREAECAARIADRKLADHPADTFLIRDARYCRIRAESAWEQHHAAMTAYASLRLKDHKR